MNSANASTPNCFHALRYCAPELLDADGFATKEPTMRSDVFALSMVIVVVGLQFLSESRACLSKRRYHLQLVTGKLPFPRDNAPYVSYDILEGRRPRTPHRFDAPGMGPAVWKIAQACWQGYEWARPEVKNVLLSLKAIANPGECTCEVHP
jgi:hypothetical protein